MALSVSHDWLAWVVIALRDRQPPAKSDRLMERWQISSYAWSDAGFYQAAWAFRPWYVTPLERYTRLSQCPAWLGEMRGQGMLSTKPVIALSRHLVSIYNCTPI